MTRFVEGVFQSLHRFLARALMGTLTLSEWAMTGLSKLPAAVAAFLIALICSTCGALGLCVGAAFFLLKVRMMDECHPYYLETEVHEN
jgi:hypothetical protein